MDIKVGFQGKHGTFSEIAAMQYFSGKETETISFANFPSIMKAVENRELDYALLPVENTTTGIIARTYDLFRQYQIHAIGEINIPIRENLIVVKGTRLEDIREVYSHPEALSQCQNFFAENPQILQVPYQDTAKSVEYVKECADPAKAALGSWRAAEYYGLTSLLENVQDSKTNMTRFLCITAKEEEDPNANKISMSLILRHAPGALYNALGILAKRGINVVKLESRPIPGKAFNYLFYIDFIGSMKNRDVREAIKELQQRCIEARILGTYKAAPEDVQ